MIGLLFDWPGKSLSNLSGSAWAVILYSTFGDAD